MFFWLMSRTHEIELVDDDENGAVDELGHPKSIYNL